MGMSRETRLSEQLSRQRCVISFVEARGSQGTEKECILPSPRPFDKVCRQFGCHIGVRVTSTRGREAQEAVKHPPMHRTEPHPNENTSDSETQSVKAENFYIQLQKQKM